jgi:hypothetical protein
MNNINKPKAFFVVSKFNEDINWLKNYVDDNYLVFNKGEPIENDYHILNVPNQGSNQRDVFRYLYYSYDQLPDLMAFVQAQPFDHCHQNIFNKLIYNKKFTCLESYGPTPANGWEDRCVDDDGNYGYLELNNSWYIVPHNQTYHQTCRYNSFDEFMNKYFSNYVHVNFIRFSPGSMYIVEKRQALYYPRDFWKSMMNELNNGARPTEGHFSERALFMIFQCNLRLKNE